MKKPKDPRELAVAMISRSTCSVQVGAVLADEWGIFSWGHNHSGSTGYGEHAEAHCLGRANRRRIPDSVIYIAASRKRNGRAVTARPCLDCQRLLKHVKGVVYRDSDGSWKQFNRQGE